MNFQLIINYFLSDKGINFLYGFNSVLILWLISNIFENISWNKNKAEAPKSNFFNWLYPSTRINEGGFIEKRVIVEEAPLVVPLPPSGPDNKEVRNV